MPKLFEVIRTEDCSGVSGCGKVADGVQFDNGQVIIQWTCRKSNQSLEVHHSVDGFIEIHGHNGKTTIKWS